MPTPFSLRRELLIAFPEIVDATVTIPDRLHIRIRYIGSADGLPNHEEVVTWINTHGTAGEGRTIERVDKINDRHRPEALLWGTTAPLVDVEDADVSLRGVVEYLTRRWPDDFVQLHNGSGAVECVVSSSTTPENEARIEQELRLVLSGVDVVVKKSSGTRERRPRSATEEKIARDWERMSDLCDPIVRRDHAPARLPPGLFAHHFTSTSLFSHLALAAHVYVEMPRTKQDVEATYGIPWQEFVDTISTERLHPVFRLPAKSYEDGMVEASIDAGGLCIMPGENRLRELAAFVDELPPVALASRMDSAWREAHAAARKQDPATAPFFNALAASASRARWVARSGQPMASVWAPVALAIDHAMRAFDLPRRDLELLTAYDTARAAEGCNARPLVADGDSVGAYLRLLYGVLPAHQEQPDSDQRIVEAPPILGRVLVPRTSGLSLRQFAQSFQGPAIRAMHLLMESPRLAEKPLEAVIQDFTREMHDFNGKRAAAAGTTSLVTDVALSLAGLSAGWGLVSIAMTIVAKRLLARSLVTDEQAANLLGCTREGAFLARVDAAIKNS